MPKFRWEDLVGQDVIEEIFGAVFVTKYQAKEKPAVNVIVKKLYSTAQVFTATFIKEEHDFNR